jgi:hypothetical protein
MKLALPLTLASLVLAFGVAISPNARAHQEPIGRFLYGLECDESLGGYSFDDGERIYYCDGRQWYIVGRL